MNAETLLRNFNEMIGENRPRSVYYATILEIRKLVNDEIKRQKNADKTLDKY